MPGAITLTAVLVFLFWATLLGFGFSIGAALWAALVAFVAGLRR